MEIRERRRRQGRKRQWLKSPQIREHVERCLCERKMSPEMIAATLGKHLCRTTLTAKAIYNFTRQARLDLRAHLPEQGKDRRQRVAHRRGRFQVGAPLKRSIESRPPEVEARIELG